MRRNVQRRYRKKKTYKKYSKRARSMRTLVPVPVGMPNKFLTKMRYYSEFALDPNVRPAIAVKEFRMSLFDIDVSVGGQQPTPFDQFCTFYRKFRVLGCKAIMQTMTMTAANPMIYGMIMQPNTGVTAGMTPQDIMQSERVTHNHKSNFTASGYQKDNMLTMKYSTKKFFGKASSQDDEFLCTQTSDSVRYGVLSCFAFANEITGASNPDSGQFSVWMEFIVLCTEPATNTAS